MYFIRMFVKYLKKLLKHTKPKDLLRPFQSYPKNMTLPLRLSLEETMGSTAYLTTNLHNK